MMIDTHCHLSKKDYDNLEEIIDCMNGNIMIVSTCNQGDLDETLELCNKYSNIYACFGLHPECADSYNEKDLLEIEKKLTKKFKNYNMYRIHHQLVLYGRYHCKAIKPNCFSCKLKNICKEKNKNE